MDETLERLFREGAHHTVSSLLDIGRETFVDLFTKLRERFPWLSENDASSAFQLVRSVRTARGAAERLGTRNTPLPMSFGINPALPEKYSYTVIGYLPNPNDPEHDITVPWTINSETPLSYEEILARAEKELNEAYDRGEKYMDARYADLHRRDELFKRIVEDKYGGHAPIDIVIREIYRRE